LLTQATAGLPLQLQVMLMKTKSASRIGLLSFSLAFVAILAVSAHAQSVVAYDDANSPNYPLSDNNWPAINGGFGYTGWNQLADTSGGGTYMEGLGANNQQVDGNYSFALYAGTDDYDISRGLAAPITVGQFSIVTRFDLTGSGPNLVNLRSGNVLSGFNFGQLLSFGLMNGNELSYTDASGFHLLPSGDARDDVWDWTVNFNAASGAYNLSVTNLGGGFATTVSGNLEEDDATVGSFAVIDSSTGHNQNLIFDAPQFASVPEPSALALLGMGLAGFWVRRRWRA
jgi:hypothetical protein